MSEIPLLALAAAISPIVLIATLVLRGRRLTPSAWATAAFAAVLAITTFELDAAEVARAAFRGGWTGAWILAIVLPALLLYEVLERSGSIAGLADAADRLAATDGRRLALTAWILPSFLQGIAGFGVPIAMTAPMLIRHGMRPAMAVSTCLVGYQWAITFGSLGSSYFMAEAVARLDGPTASSFALRAALILGVNAIISGVIVLRRSGGDWRRDLPVVGVVGLLMAVTLVLVAMRQPALGSTAAGLVGLSAAWVLFPGSGRDTPSIRTMLAHAFPYLLLTALVIGAWGIGPLSDWLTGVAPLAPSVEGAVAAYGHSISTGPVAPVFAPLHHPWLYVTIAALAGMAFHRRRGDWPVGTTRAALADWKLRASRVTGTILGITVLAGIMVDAGMLRALAVAAADSLGIAFVAVAPIVGMVGSAITGGTTPSNALFAAFQADVAVALGKPVPVLLAAQTAGGNVGNALAPVNVAVGATVVDREGHEGRIIGYHLPAAALLMATVIALTILQAWLA